MGRGDKKTAKGKRFKGSFGKSRPANAAGVKKKNAAAAAKKKSS
ncbi:MAG: 30S ribosomal protein THX [Chitinophagaceae bacterium]|nr:30S ribosomal protein THX [Chitinophagaceae bacterium]